jgi:hypothetical protein
MEEYVLPEWIRPVALARLHVDDIQEEDGVHGIHGMHGLQGMMHGVQMQGVMPFSVMPQLEVRTPSSMDVVLVEEAKQQQQQQQQQPSSSGRTVSVGRRKGQKGGGSSGGGSVNVTMMEVDGPVPGGGGGGIVENASPPFLPSIVVLDPEPNEVETGTVRRTGRRK